MTITIHWGDDGDRAALVGQLVALSGRKVTTSTMGVVVDDRVAYRWLHSQLNGVPDPAPTVDVDGTAIEIYPAPMPNGSHGLNDTQRAALNVLHSGDQTAIGRIHHNTMAYLRRKGLVPEGIL